MADPVDLTSWIGRSETATDIATSAPLNGLAALLDHDTPPWPADEVVPLGHWLYFLPRARQSQMDADGHPHRGGFLPPVPLPRRMWAGGRLTFECPIPIGAVLERRSTITDVTLKTGRSGPMVFVTVRHEIAFEGRCAIREEQDIVYREMPTLSATPSVSAPQSAPATQSAPGISATPAETSKPAGDTSRPLPSTGATEAPRPSHWTREFVPDPVQLFRFSALTFNAHRIHYDRPYAREIEHYPGLVVQGPFVATLLLDHFLRRMPGARVVSFAFRAQRPLYDTAPFSLCLDAQATQAELWTLDADRQVTMTASVQFVDRAAASDSPW
jgi:3-methylfumaryl-CoA hydratase